MIQLIKYILKKFNFLDLLRNNKTYINLAYLYNPSLRQNLRLEVGFYKPFIPKDALCFDIGANVGGKVFVFNKLGARIVAVEPNEDAFNIMSLRYGKLKNVKLLKIGIGEKNEIKTFYKAVRSTLSTFSVEDYNSTLNDRRFFEKEETTIKQEVEISTLDNLMQKYGNPHYCKIATVGYELEIIKGLSSSIPFLSITCNLPYHIEKTKECVNLIGKLGDYEYNYLYSTVNNGFESKSWQSLNQMTDTLSGMVQIKHSNYIEIFARLKNHV